MGSQVLFLITHLLGSTLSLYIKGVSTIFPLHTRSFSVMSGRPNPVSPYVVESGQIIFILHLFIGIALVQYIYKN